MVTSHPPRRGFLAFALLTAIATAACGAESDSDATSEAEATDAASEESPTEAAPSAADGTDYAACGDGSCEVAVSSTPVEFEFEEFTLTVTATEDGIATEKVGDDGGTGSSSSSGAYCLDYITANGFSGSCYAIAEETPPVPDPDPGVLALELLHFSDGVAIIRLTMG